MIKNGKYIIIILTLLVTFAIGYALFSGNVKVSTSVNVDPTSIDIDLTCGTIEKTDAINTDNYYTTQSGVEAPETNCSGYNAQWSANYLYPGASQGYWYQITNNSSFDVLLKNVEISGNDDTNKDDSGSDIIQGGLLIYNKTKDKLTSYNSNMVSLTVITINGSGELKCLNSKCIMHPGDSYTIGIKEYVNEHFTGNNLNLTVKRTIKFGIEQYNS